MMTGPTIRTLSGREMRRLIALAKEIEDGHPPLEQAKAYHSLEYADGALFLDAINDAPCVVVLRTASLYTFPFEQGSGTDHLRKRIEAQRFFHSMSRLAGRAPYYLSSDKVPDNLSLDALPIQVGLSRIVPTFGPSKWEKNPISGHEYVVDTPERNQCHLEGNPSQNFRTVGAALKVVAFQEDHPFDIPRTSKELRFAAHSDDMLTQAFQKERGARP